MSGDAEMRRCGDCGGWRRLVNGMMLVILGGNRLIVDKCQEVCDLASSFMCEKHEIRRAGSGF